MPNQLLREALTIDRCPRDWWRRHWERTVETADMVPHGRQDWLHWLETWARVGRGYEPDETMLRADNDTHLGLTRLVAGLS